ncbi:hypothetical protein D3C85_1470590 [compost metagenome]
METEGFLRHRRQTVPVATGCFQQGVGADDIGLDKVARAIDGAVHMGLCGQVHHRIRTEFGEHHIQPGAVTDIHLIEAVARRVGHRGQ